MTFERFINEILGEARDRQRRHTEFAKGHSDPTSVAVHLAKAESYELFANHISAMWNYHRTGLTKGPD